MNIKRLFLDNDNNNYLELETIFGSKQYQQRK